MKIIVLGSAAGGGFPQWNCNCRNCHGLRHGTMRTSARTQSSIAVSANGSDWLLINASPDILSQLKATPALQPGGRAAGAGGTEWPSQPPDDPAPAPGWPGGGRDSGIKAVLLMDAQIDHATGLLMLREGPRLPLYCTSAVWGDLNSGLPLAPVLSFYCGVDWHELPARRDTETALVLPGLDGIAVIPLALDSKAPPYSPHRNDPQIGDNLGLLIRNTGNGKTLFYAPGLGRIEPPVRQAMAQADCVLVDGTFWTEDEMITQGFSSKKAADMGHLPQAGPGGMLEVLDGIGARRKVLIHINNTNPILDEDSAQRAELARRGVEVAWDGMEIDL